MRTPTVSQLHGGSGYSITIAVEASLVPSLIPQIKHLGGGDIVVSTVRMLIA
jgi:ATP phosphoribosyltransferase-like protein